MRMALKVELHCAREGGPGIRFSSFRGRRARQPFRLLRRSFLLLTASPGLVPPSGALSSDGTVNRHHGSCLESLITRAATNERTRAGEEDCRRGARHRAQSIKGDKVSAPLLPAFAPNSLSSGLPSTAHRDLVRASTYSHPLLSVRFLWTRYAPLQASAFGELGIGLFYPPFAPLSLNLPLAALHIAVTLNLRPLTRVALLLLVGKGNSSPVAFQKARLSRPRLLVSLRPTDRSRKFDTLRYLLPVRAVDADSSPHRKPKKRGNRRKHKEGGVFLYFIFNWKNRCHHSSKLGNISALQLAKSCLVSPYPPLPPARLSQPSLPKNRHLG